MARKRLYVPITRSGSSIIASLLTQMLQNAAKNRKEQVNRRIASGEITPLKGEMEKHPGCTFFLLALPVSIILMVMMKGCN